MSGETQYHDGGTSWRCPRCGHKWVGSEHCPRCTPMPTNPLEPELVRGEPQLPGITVRPTEPPDGGPCWCCVVKKTTHALSIHRLEDFPLGLPHMMVSLCVECYCEVSQFVQKRREELWVKTADEATKP